MSAKNGRLEARPAFQFYAGDFLASDAVACMSNAEVGAYIKLLARSWQGVGLPSNPRKLAKLVGESPESFTEMWEESLSECFFERDGKLWNERLERERGVAEDYSEKQRLLGKFGALKQHGSIPKSTTFDQWLEQNASDDTANGHQGGPRGGPGDTMASGQGDTMASGQAPVPSHPIPSHPTPSPPKPEGRKPRVRAPAPSASPPVASVAKRLILSSRRIMRIQLESWRGTPLSFSEKLWLMKWARGVGRAGNAITPEACSLLLRRIRDPNAADPINDVPGAVQAALGATPQWRRPFDPTTRKPSHSATREERNYVESDDEWLRIPGASA